MGYIKKLKNNELVGGTDKTTIYPVTSTEAVFEEITNGNESSFKSQKTINGEHDGRIKGLENEMPDTVKSITINGGQRVNRVDENGNVDLTIYSDGGQDYEGLTEVVADLRDIVGENPEEPQSGTLLERVDDLEENVGTGGTVDSRIAITKAELEGQIAGKQKTLSVGAGITLTSDGVISATADPSVGKVVETLPTGDDIIEGMIYLVQTTTAGTYKQWVHNGSTWVDKGNVSLGITTDDTLDSTSSNPIQNAAIAAQIGYFVCGNGYASSEIKDVDALGFNLPNVGGDFKIKMNAANTHAGPVYLRFNSSNDTKAELKYNRESVSPTNTWEAGEVISVYYDGSVYQASNAQGGGGKAEKIKYDNSASRLGADNVQEALDKIAEEVSNDIEIDLSGYNTIAGAIGSQKKWTTASTSSTNRHILIPVNTNKIYKLATPVSYVAYAWLTSSDVSFGNSAPLVEGTSVVDSIPSNGVIGAPPPTTQFLYFRTNWGSADTIYPSYFAEIGTVKDVIGELKEDLSNIDNIIDDNSFYVINIGKLALTKGWLGANSYSMSDYGSHTAIKTNGASRMRIDVGSRIVYVYYAKTYTAPSSAVSPDFCDGYTSRVGYSSDTEVALPSDCQYVIIGRWSNQTDDNSPLSVSLNTFHDYVEDKLETDKLDFAQGSYGSSGIRSYNTGYIRSNLFLGQRTVSVKSGYNIKYIHKWESENNLVSYITPNKHTYNIPNDGYYYSIVVNKSDNTAISPNEDVMDYDGSSKSILDYVIENNLTRIKSATLNVIGDSISNPDRSEYSASTVWWGVMRDLLGLNIGSYSCVSSTPIGGSSSSSFHNRVKNMTLDGTITIIAGGMNDLGANNIPLGTFNYSSSLASQIEADATLTNSFIPAYRELIEYILTNNKNTRLYLCTITPRAIKKTSMTDAQLFFPWTNPSTHNNWAEFNGAIRKLAHDYGIGLIDFANIGMYQQNGFNDESGTLPANNIWTSDGVHPTVDYQKKMGELATSVIANTMF